jgi:hypothetical protein
MADLDRWRILQDEAKRVRAILGESQIRRFMFMDKTVYLDDHATWSTQYIRGPRMFVVTITDLTEQYGPKEPDEPH